MSFLNDGLEEFSSTGGRAARVIIKRALDLFGSWKADPMVINHPDRVAKVKMHATLLQNIVKIKSD